MEKLCSTRCAVSSSLLVEKGRARYRSLNAIPVRFEISSKSSTTGFINRNPFCASNRFGFSFGIARDEWFVSVRSGFGIAEDANPFIDLFLNSSLSVKPAICMAPKKWPMPFPTYAR